MNLQDFDLVQDPFPIVPDGPVHNWAGREDLRSDLVDIVKGVRARDIGITEFIILHGEYGAGKSHALRYLRTLISEDKENFNSLAIYLESPRVATKLNFLELHRYVVKSVGRDRIKQFCVGVKARVDQVTLEVAQAAGMGDLQNKDSFIEKAISQFPTDDRRMIMLLAGGADDESKVFDFLIGTGKCDDEEYEGKVDSDFIAAKVLSDFFRVITSELAKGQRLLESIYLFVDESEVLAEAKASESELVFNGLRNLINGMPYRFGLMMSFSAATALIEAIMPQHLLKRLTRPYIEVPVLDDQGAVEFLKSQINFYRPGESHHQGSFYPFSQGAIEYVVQNTTTLTPRNLFIDCKRVLERAIRRHDLQPGQEISIEMAQSILQSYK